MDRLNEIEARAEAAMTGETDYYELARLVELLYTELRRLQAENDGYKADIEAGRLVRLQDCDECRYKLQSDAWKYYTYPCSECRKRVKDHFARAALGKEREDG